MENNSCAVAHPTFSCIFLIYLSKTQQKQKSDSYRDRSFYVSESLWHHCGAGFVFKQATAKPGFEAS